MDTHSLCIAIPRLYANARTSRKPPDRHLVIPVLSTFVVVVGVKTNRIRERPPRRYPSCNTMLHHSSSTDTNRSRRGGR